MDRDFLKKSKSRLIIIFIVIVLMFFVYSLRLYQYQVVDYDFIASKVDEKLNTVKTIKALRGTIVDRNGEVLAFSKKTYNLKFAKPDSNELNKKVIERIDKDLEKIVKVYPKVTFSELKEIIGDSQVKYFYILEDVPQEIAEVLSGIDPFYFSIESSQKRIHPNGSLAAKVIGNIDSDGEGVSGVEEYYNEKLKGVDGEIKAKTDTAGRPSAFAEVEEQKVVNGETIKLTIDVSLQHYVESQCRKYREEFDANNVIVIVQDAKSGEILAMSDSFSYDPNNPMEILDDSLKAEYDAAETNVEKTEVLYKMWKNPIVSMLYEPGSVMKIVTASAALEEGVVTRDTPFLCKGYKKLYGETIRCHTYPESHGYLNFEKGFIGSCNVVFAETVLKLKKDKYYEYLDGYGLLESVDTELPMAENPIFIPKDDLYDIDYTKMSFGHSISITPLHVANIAMSISNDGVVIPAKTVKQIGNTSLEKINPDRVISSETSKEVLRYMEGVANSSPEYLKVPGYRTASKTGTTVKFVDGKYDDYTFISSVVDIVPADNPKVNVIAIVDEPKTVKNTVMTAGVIAKNISLEAMRNLKILPNEEKNVDFSIVPNFVGMSESEARRLAGVKGITLKFKYMNDDKTGVVTSQFPIDGTLVKNDVVVELVVD